MIDAIATVGDVGNINCWSGIPWHFMKAAQAAGMKATPWCLSMDAFTHSRRIWNARQWLMGRGLGGYQYSEAFLSKAEASIPESVWGGNILSFNQHFPRSRSVRARGGRLIHYIDATVASAVRAGGFAAYLPARIKAEALAAERRNFEESDWVVTMGRWAAQSVIEDCGVQPEKVHTILPGANLTLPGRFKFREHVGLPGKVRPLILGFVGKDWRRKGLPFLMEVRAVLKRKGLHAVVRCAGHRPSELTGMAGLEYVGFIDKAKSPEQFLDFITGCDIGCLFSQREPLGISTLEFLRAGVPVTGFVNEGIADTIPPDAGLRFSDNATVDEVAESIGQCVQDESVWLNKIRAAQAWSSRVTWQRCALEWKELLATGTVIRPVQPWREGGNSDE